jgi:8-oxo-dGTP diphosphatase
MASLSGVWARAVGVMLPSRGVLAIPVPDGGNLGLVEGERIVLARGPWSEDRVRARWRDDPYQPAAEMSAAADAELERLRARGSPSHDGLAAGLASWRVRDGCLELELQPVRWSLRLLERDAVGISASLVVRSADGRWLAGRRAPWLASWAGRWALGAAGSIEVGEQPLATMRRELAEEWSVRAQRITLEALLRLPSGALLLLGQAWLAEGAEVTADAEHEEFAWWPAEVADWPAEAHEPLRLMASLVQARRGEER